MAHDQDEDRHDGDDDVDSSSSSLGSGVISSPWPSASSSDGGDDDDYGGGSHVDDEGESYGSRSDAVSVHSASSSASSSSSRMIPPDDYDDDASSSGSSASSFLGSSGSSSRSYHDGDEYHHDDQSDREGGESCRDDEDVDGLPHAGELLSGSNNGTGSSSSSGLVGLVKTSTSSSSSPLFDDYVSSGPGRREDGDHEVYEEELAMAADDGRDDHSAGGMGGWSGGATRSNGEKKKCPSPFSELERRSELTRRRTGAGRCHEDDDGYAGPTSVSTGAAPPSPVRRRRRGGEGTRTSGTRRKSRRSRYGDERYHDGDDLSFSEYLPPALRCLVRLLPPCPKFCTSNLCLLAASAVWFIAQVRFHAYMFPSSSTSHDHPAAVPPDLSRRRGGTNHESVHPRKQLTKRQAEALRRERREEAESALGSAAAHGNEAFQGIKKPPKNVRKSRKGRKDAGVEKLSDDCEYAKWQTYDFPVCNNLHEIDLTTALGMRRGMDKLPGDMGVGGDFSNVADDSDEDVEDAKKKEEEAESMEGHKTRRAKGLFPGGDDNWGGNGSGGMGYLGSGLWRNVWRIADLGSGGESGGGAGGVLKMMKMDHPVDERNFDRHRRDALTMERLTSNPHVTTPFGYCGNTVFADCVGCSSRTNPRGLDEVLFLDSPARREMDKLRRREGGATRSTEVGRLRLALDVARGLRALHAGVPGGGPIAHADIQAKQFLLDERGRVVINDFNRCRFVPFRKKKKNKDGNVKGNATDANGFEEAVEAGGGASPPPPEYCPFRIATAPGTSRSPEEYKSRDLTEKIDVFSAGHVLYGILTGRKSFANSKKGNPLETKKKIKRGETPRIDEARDVGGRRGDAALAGLVERSYVMDPAERISASELVDELERALASMLEDEANKEGKLPEDESQRLKGELMTEGEEAQMAGLGRGRGRGRAPYDMGGQNSSLR